LGLGKRLHNSVWIEAQIPLSVSSYIVHTYLTEALLHMLQQMLQTWTVKQNSIHGHECWQHLENSPEGIKKTSSRSTCSIQTLCSLSSLDKGTYKPFIFCPGGSTIDSIYLRNRRYILSMLQQTF